MGPLARATQQSTTGGGFELPPIIEGIFDRASGVFDRIIDLEFFEKEIDLARKKSALEAEFQEARAPSGSASIPAGIDGQTLGGFNLQANLPLILLVAGGVGLALALRRGR